MLSVQEKNASVLPGAVMFIAGLVSLALGVLLVLTAAGHLALFLIGLGLLVLVAPLIFKGLFVVNPNQAMVTTFFGHYTGSRRDAGWFWKLPFTVRRRLSLRIRNFNSERLKVNDQLGNPVEIAAVIVWRVVDSAKASFDIDDYVQYVAIQSETALRHMASLYPYDNDSDVVPSLRGNTDEVSKSLQAELVERLQHAGVEVLEARLAHLAYAAEIAGAMLQRQQAGAIIAARTQIVQAAVGMVQTALTTLSQQNIVELDEERKAQMVSNMLVVLASERGTQPVVNTGSLY